MGRDHFVDCVCSGMKTYLRTFALSDDMTLRDEGDVEWIAPKPGRPGPMVFVSVSLAKDTAAQRVDELLPGIRAGTAPREWFVSPDWTPDDLTDILKSKGFRNASPEGKDCPGMMLKLRDAPRWPAPSPEFAVREVQSVSDFAAWCGIVNNALFHTDMISPESYAPWLLQNVYTMYLAFKGDVPVATVAVLELDGHATLEFVATKEEHRRRGAATAVCMHAMLDLMVRGVPLVTLRASSEGFPVYEKLGFRTCCTIVQMNYHGTGGDEP